MTSQLTLAEKIRRIRLSNNMSQKDFSSKLGLEPAHYCKIENEEISVTKKTLGKLYEAFGVRETLFDDEPDITETKIIYGILSYINQKKEVAESYKSDFMQGYLYACANIEEEINRLKEESK